MWFMIFPKVKVWFFFSFLTGREDNGTNAGLILIKYQYMLTSSIYFSLKFHDVN